MFLKASPGGLNPPPPNGNAGQIVDFIYPLGLGFVYYSSIPLDFYIVENRNRTCRQASHLCPAVVREISTVQRRVVDHAPRTVRNTRARGRDVDVAAQSLREQDTAATGQILARAEALVHVAVMERQHAAGQDERFEICFAI